MRRNFRGAGVVSVYHKIHRQGSNTVLAACDSELVGKTFREGEICFTVSEKFYKEGKVTAEQLAGLLHEYGNINLVGEKAISVALKEKLINEKSIIKIQEIPHVQIFKI